MAPRSRAVPALPLRTESHSDTHAARARRVPPAPITALRWAGRPLPAVPLPLDQHRWTLGAAGCDLIIPRSVSTRVSRTHAIVTRSAAGLTLTDAPSKNGLAATAAGPRVPHLDLTAGQLGWVADVGVLALSSPVARLRTQLAWRLGLAAHAAVDDALTRVVTDQDLVVFTPVAADAISLAAELHAAGPRQANPLRGGAVRPPLEQVVGGTIVLDLARLGPLPAPYVHRLLGGGGVWRTIYIAPSLRVLHTHLGVAPAHLATVTLVPLAHRAAEILPLVADLWADGGATHHPDALGPVVRRALARHRWPRGLGELQLAAARLLAYLTHGAVRPAAAALGISHQALTAHFARLGFGAVDIGRGA
jgi:hypothetical protein